MEEFQLWIPNPQGFKKLARIADEFRQTQPRFRSQAATTTMRIDNNPRCKLAWAFNQLGFANWQVWACRGISQSSSSACSSNCYFIFCLATISRGFEQISWVSVDEEDVVWRRHSQLKKHFGCRCCFSHLIRHLCHFWYKTSAFATVRYACGPIVSSPNSVRKSFHPVCNCDESRNLPF